MTLAQLSERAAAESRKCCAMSTRKRHHPRAPLATAGCRVQAPISRVWRVLHKAENSCATWRLNAIGSVRCRAMLSLLMAQPALVNPGRPTCPPQGGHSKPAFRDTKDPRFRMGLSATRNGEPTRRDRLLLINASAMASLTRLGAGESLGLDRLL